MCKEICRHPSSEKNFFERLRQEKQAKEIIEIVLKSADVAMIDSIPLKTTIPMFPRRTEHNYRKDLRKSPFYLSQGLVGDIIMRNGQTLQNQSFGFRLSLE